jgi:hypothetical protein
MGRTSLVGTGHGAQQPAVPGVTAAGDAYVTVRAYAWGRAAGGRPTPVP